MTTAIKEQINQFWMQTDENGVTNLKKTDNAKVIRRVDTTDKNKSYEETEKQSTGDNPLGVVEEDGKLIGFGIHIYNEDVYPLQSFEIYLRGCDLVGKLNLDNCEDLIFVDVYRNRIQEVSVNGCNALRILGLQDNQISSLDAHDLISCQGIDIGKNRLVCIDVSNNAELVELYVNDNQITSIDISKNQKLKYFYCHNNGITELDTTNNPLLRHLNATGNPLTKIVAFAPQSDGKLPLEVYAGNGGYVGLSFSPVYNAQWKETGEWRQSYYAYPKEGFAFAGWYDESDRLLSEEAEWIDEYGKSRILYAKYNKA